MWSFGLSFFAYKANRLAAPGLQGPRQLRQTSSPIRTSGSASSNTATIVVGSVALQLVVGFLLALLFANEFPLRRYLLMLVLARR